MLARLTFATLLCAAGLCAQTTEYLVVEKGHHALGFYSSEGKRLYGVTVGQHPHEIALSTDRRYAYITDNGVMRLEHEGQGGSTVSIVDLVERKKIGEISTGEARRPHGITVDPSTGRLLVTTEMPDRLLVIDPVARKVLRSYDTQGKISHMVVLGPKGEWAYVSNSSSGTVSAIHLASGKVELIPTGQRPQGAVLSKDGSELYVVNKNSNLIAVIDTASRKKIAAIPTGGGPSRIALTPDGMLGYHLAYDKAVGFADPKTRKQVSQVPLGLEPVSFNLSSDGKLAFASAENDDVVFVISVPEKKVIRKFQTAKGAAPDPVITWTRPK